MRVINRVISGLKSGHASLSQPTRLFVSVSISVQEELPHLIMHCFTNFIFRLSLEVVTDKMFLVNSTYRNIIITYYHAMTCIVEVLGNFIDSFILIDLLQISKLIHKM